MPGLCHESSGGVVGKVVSIEKQRTLRLAAEIERDLRRTGARSLAVRASDVEDPARWRRAAIIAAHQLGHRANTYAGGNYLALAVHRPVTEAEDRYVAEVISAWILAGERP